MGRERCEHHGLEATRAPISVCAMHGRSHRGTSHPFIPLPSLNIHFTLQPIPIIHCGLSLFRKNEGRPTHLALRRLPVEDHYRVLGRETVCSGPTIHPGIFTSARSLRSLPRCNFGEEWAEGGNDSAHGGNSLVLSICLRLPLFSAGSR